MSKWSQIQLSRCPLKSSYESSSFLGIVSIIQGEKSSHLLSKSFQCRCRGCTHIGARYSTHLDCQPKWCTLWCSVAQLYPHVALQPRGLQHTRLPCPSPSPGAHSNSGPSSLWCHPPISSSVIPFSSCLQSFPVSGSFPVSQFFASGNQSIGASAWASVLPMNVQGWFPLGWTGLIT